jgi:hypothetical protein
MRVQHPKKKINIIGWLRNFENPLVNFFIRKCDLQRQFFCNEINRAQADGELLQKTAQHEEQRLGCFNFIFKLKAFRERLRRPNQFQHSIGLSIGPFPHPDSFRPEPRPQLFFIKGRKLAKSMNPPLVEDWQDLLR